MWLVFVLVVVVVDVVCRWLCVACCSLRVARCLLMGGVGARCWCC